jgi:MinD-like ATPase involved in chromosome partitioning or flagellar assembly
VAETEELTKDVSAASEPAGADMTPPEATLTPTPAAMTGDQADGLRELFGSGAPRTLALACALDADDTVWLGQGVAQILRREGTKTLLIDEVRLADRRAFPKLAYRTKYDLGQVMENLVPIEKAIVDAEENLKFACAIRLRQSHDLRRAKHPNVQERLAAAGIDIDVMIIATQDPSHEGFGLFANDIDVIVVATPEQTSLVRALELIRSMSGQDPERVIPVLMVGKAEDECKAAFERLQQASDSLLGIDLEDLGWVAARPTIDPLPVRTRKNPTGLILPSGLFKKLANLARGLGR